MAANYIPLIVYAREENMANPAVTTDVLPGIQDGYNFAISDYLGADIPCYQPMQTDLPNGMSLNDSEVRFSDIVIHHVEA